MRRYIKTIAANICWWSGAGPVVRFFREPNMVIIAYHCVRQKGIDDSKLFSYAHISVDLHNFKQQVRYFKKRGYFFARFTDVKNIYKEHPGKKIAALYFDDGFKDVLTYVYPVLKKNHIPATLFLTTDYIDQKHNPGVYLSWEELYGMKDVFEFGSHSVSHKKLNKISINDAEFEMEQSKKIIEERLYTKVTAFSYPKGRFSDELRILAGHVGYISTTADSVFHKVRPDSGDNMSLFKLKTIIKW